MSRRTVEVLCQPRSDAPFDLLRSFRLIEEESVLEMQFLDHERRFALGAQLHLTPYDLYSTMVTLWQFGISIAEAIEVYARGLGLAVDAPAAAA